MKKRILITGSNGLLGSKLIQLIQKETDWSILSTSKQAKSDDPTVLHYKMDITQHQEVADVIAKTQPDIIINTAALTHVDQCELEQELCQAINVEAIKNLVKICRKQDLYLLHLSTDFIFNGQSGPYTEKDTPDPVNFYGKCKWQAEQIILNSGIRAAIARTILVYGFTPHMSRSNIVLWVKEKLENKEVIQVVNDQWRTPTLAEDLARGCYLISKEQHEGIFNLSGSEMLTPYELALKTAAFFKLDASLIREVDGGIFSQAALRPPKTGLIIDKAIRQLHYQPHSFEEGLTLISKQMREAF